MPDSPSPPSEQPLERPNFKRRLRLPVVSGKWTVIWLLVCFALTAVLIPVALNLKVWVEIEIVLSCWWVLWCVLLTKLLYKGEQVSDDHSPGEPRSWGGFSGHDMSGCGVMDFEGILIIIGLVLALALVWVLIEFAIPIVFFLLYFLVRGMLAQAVNGRFHCRGNLTLSAANGIFWSTLYTAPLVLAVWMVHWIHMKRGGA